MRPFILAFMLLCSATALAQECLEYVDNQIEVLDTLALDGFYTYQLVIEGDVAFICSAYYLHAVDISDPNDLQLISSLPDYGGISIALTGGLACLATQDDDLHFIDVSDPANMQHVKTIADLESLQNVTAQGSYFYVGANHLGLYTVDATDPTDPQLLDLVDSPETVRVVYAYGDWLYGSASGADLSVYDISNPAQPVLHNIADSYYNGGRDLLALGGYLYASSVSNLVVYSLANPGNPMRWHQEGVDGHIFALAEAGGTLFAGNFPTLQAFSLDDPVHPAIIGRKFSSLEVWDLAESNGTLFGLASDNVFFSMDVSSPASTLPLGNADTIGEAQDVVFRETFGYPVDLGFVANGDEGLWIHDPESFYPLSLTPTPGFVHNLVLDGDTAFLAMGETGLQAVDILNPANPILKDDVNTPGSAVAIDLYHSEAGRFAVIADSSYDMGVYNVTDRTHLVFQGIYYFPGRVYDVAVKDNYALATDNTGKLQVMDLTPLPDPAVQVTTLELDGAISQMHLDGNTLYLAGSNHLHSVDVTDPANPHLLDSHTTVWNILDMDVHGGVLYCATPNTGMDIIAANDPSNLQHLATFHAYGEPEGIGVNTDSGVVYLCLGENGMDQLALQCLLSPTPDNPPAIKATSLGAAYPNPFNPRTTISYDLATAATVQLQVHDVAGRLVRTLIAGQQQGQGRHLVSWDGKDNGGRSAAAGVYLYRLQAAGVDETRPMTLLK